MLLTLKKSSRGYIHVLSLEINAIIYISMQIKFPQERDFSHFSINNE